MVLNGEIWSLLNDTIIRIVGSLAKMFLEGKVEKEKASRGNENCGTA